MRELETIVHYLHSKRVTRVPGWAWTTNLSVNSRKRSPIAPQRHEGTLLSILTESKPNYQARRSHLSLTWQRLLLQASDNHGNGVHSARRIPWGSRAMHKAEGQPSVSAPPCSSPASDAAPGDSPSLSRGGPPREAERPMGSVMPPCLLWLYSTTCAAGQRFSRWGPCGRSWKEIGSNEEKWKAGRTRKGMNETKRPPRKPVRRFGPDPERKITFIK